MIKFQLKVRVRCRAGPRTGLMLGIVKAYN